jgi:hypothetical protein
VTTTEQARLDARYGRGPRRDRQRLLRALLVAFVAGAAVWAVWSVVVLARTNLSWRVTGADLADPAVARLSFEVDRADAAAVLCTVRANASDGAVVGWVDVRVPAGERTSTVTATLRTVRPATDGGVVACVRR